MSSSYQGSLGSPIYDGDETKQYDDGASFQNHVKSTTLIIFCVTQDGGGRLTTTEVVEEMKEQINRSYFVGSVRSAIKRAR